MKISTLKYILRLQFEEMTFHSSFWPYAIKDQIKTQTGDWYGESLEQ